MCVFLSIFKKCLHIPLLFILPLLLFSCVDEPTVKEGIEVLPSVSEEYSESTDKRASEVFKRFLIGYYVKDTGKNPTDEVKNRLTERAEEMRLETRDTEVLESDYISFINALDEHCERLVDILASFSKGNTDLAALREIYVDLSAGVDGAYTGKLFYRLSLFVYDCKYDKQMELFDELGYPHLKIKAEELKAEKEIFVSKIGEENCIGAMQMFFLVGDVFLGGAFEDGVLASFSDEEVLLLLENVDFSEIGIGTEGWELLLSYYLNATSFRELGYYPAMLKYAVSSGDGEAVAAVMSDAVRLINSLKAKLTASEISALRRKDKDAFLRGIFMRFDDGDWDSFTNITSANINKPSYHAYAAEHYGEDYLLYASRVQGITLSELRLSVGAEDFGVKLEEYLAGISPALSYGVKG